MEQRETAYIEALLGVHKKEQAKVIFNPAEYSLEKGNQFSSAPLPGLSNPVLSFVSGDADSPTLSKNGSLLTLQLSPAGSGRATRLSFHRSL